MDPRTFLFVLFCGNLALSLLLFSFDFAGPRSSVSRLLIFARLAHAACWLLLFLRGTIPNLYSAAVGDSLLFLGFAADVAAVWRYRNLAGWRAMSGFSSAVAITVFWGVWALYPGQPTKWVTAASLIVAGFFFLVARGYSSAWRTATPLRGILAGGTALLGLGHLARAFASEVGKGFSLLDAAPEQTLTLTGQYLYTLVHGFGFLLLAKEDDDLEIRRLATSDSLTGTLNRHTFFERGASHLGLARRHQQALAFLLLDLDHFKQINDVYGHPAGDDALRQFASACRSELRTTDFLGRLGGEEFAILLPSTPLEGAVGVAQRIVDRVARLEIGNGREKARMTTSIGVTELQPGDGELEHLLGRADAALYRAKKQGRNRVELEE